jgi:hypothetical protein
MELGWRWRSAHDFDAATVCQMCQFPTRRRCRQDPRQGAALPLSLAPERLTVSMGSNARVMYSTQHFGFKIARFLTASITDRFLRAIAHAWQDSCAQRQRRARYAGGDLETQPVNSCWWTLT